MKKEAGVGLNLFPPPGSLWACEPSKARAPLGWAGVARALKCRVPQRHVTSGPTSASVTQRLAAEGLWAVLSSDLGCWPLGRLLLQQRQRVSLLNGAKLLLLCPLELGGVSDLGVV